jgi:hypothetical protein
MQWYFNAAVNLIFKSEERWFPVAFDLFLMFLAISIEASPSGLHNFMLKLDIAQQIL